MIDKPVTTFPSDNRVNEAVVDLFCKNKQFWSQREGVDCIFKVYPLPKTLFMDMRKSWTSKGQIKEEASEKVGRRETSTYHCDPR